MIVPDVNLLIHAYNSESPVHDAAREWWEGLLNNTRRGPRLGGDARLHPHQPHRHVPARPLPVGAACDRARQWLVRPYVGILHPSERHAEILFNLLEALGAGANLTTDAHLAALAIDHQAELHSTDADFQRFAGVRWVNPVT